MRLHGCARELSSSQAKCMHRHADSTFHVCTVKQSWRHTCIKWQAVKAQNKAIAKHKGMAKK